MDENKNPIKMKLSEQLPSHSPDPGTWQRLVSKIDELDAEAVYQEKLQQLPLHTPDQGTWNIIYNRLNRLSYYKTAARIALTAAAGLLLFITVSQVFNFYQKSTLVPTVAKHEQNVHQPINTNNEKSPAMSANEVQRVNQKIKVIPTDNTSLFNAGPTERPATLESENNLEIFSPGQQINTLSMADDENMPEPVAQVTSVEESSTLNSETINSEINPEISALPKDPINTAILPPVKYYTPGDTKSDSKRNYFALAMNYLPENISNGTDNSLFHNLDLTASYNKEKVRFNTSLGMAYNEEQLEFDMNYDINTPVTLTRNDGNVDTVGYNVENMRSQYQGTEKHQYFTYNLGIGRRLFNIGKFSSWINAGAGFGIRLNDPDLISSTEKSIKNQYNAQINEVKTSKPEYNDVNVNFVTGIDFNYKLFKKLSITFTPTSRWYFKPVLTKDNQATDELTLGFKTGMKFDF
jgi:hypothetical protein